MKPGPELDALVDEKVMGRGAIKIPSDYSTNIAVAWQLVTKLHTNDYKHFELAGSDPSRWECYYSEGYGVGESASHAICLAALNSVGVKFED
jgi:hypothetical protein